MPTSHVTFDPHDVGVPLWRSPSSTSAAGGHSVGFHTPVTNICNNHNPINHLLFADLVWRKFISDALSTEIWIRIIGKYEKAHYKIHI